MLNIGIGTIFKKIIYYKDKLLANFKLIVN
ncbi:MAG: hypothetical protein CFH15_01562 [Alphaproteobacteria bacterium MarineAlpha5_Bin5]|nr:MAG: hypothetical protein CFH15_01562 [Alphaproteobacteria bacterium MarineAlpha5_Bin5]